MSDVLITAVYILLRFGMAFLDLWIFYLSILFYEDIWPNMNVAGHF